MSHRPAAWLAWLLWALCATLAVLAVLLDFHNPQVRSHLKFVVLAGVPLLVYPTIGAFVVSRRPKNAVGWIFCGMGFIFEVLALAGAFSNYTRFAHPISLAGGKFLLSLNPWVVGPYLMLATVLLLLLFPDGKLPTTVARDQVSVKWLWRTVAGMAVCGTTLLSLWWLSWPGGAVEALGRLAGVSLIVSFVASVFSVFVRWQSAEGSERQQLKWFAYGAAVFTGSFFFLQVAGDKLSEWAIFVLIVTGLMVLPLTVGIAILKYRLYDIDVIINRTLVYGLLTATLLLIYFGGVAATQAILQTLTGQEKLPQLAVVVSTLVIAALFTPLRQRMQSLIDRSFYRRKYDAAKILEAFSAKLRNETDLDALSTDVTSVVRETMQPAHVSLWLRPMRVPQGGA
jgi:cytochrome b subunit of formate dehydrogenase